MAVSQIRAGWADIDGDEVSTSPVIREGTAMVLYSKKDEHGPHLVHLVFVDKRLSFGHVKVPRQSQNILETVPRTFVMVQTISRPSDFKVQLYHHTLMFFGKGMHTKLVCTMHSYKSDMDVGYAVEVVMKPWNDCTKAAGMRIIQITLQLYMSYSNRTMIFDLIGSHEEG